MSSNGQPPTDESDLSPACREMIARLARQAKKRRARAATDAGPMHGAQEREPDEP